MAVGSNELPELHPVDGICLGTCSAGVNNALRDDLVVIQLDPRASCAAVFTQNAFCAAPVQIAKQKIAKTAPRYLVINTGNANAGTGELGLVAAESVCESVAKLAGVNTDEVLPFSTGVIGELLPADKIINGVPNALADLAADGWLRAASGIMTTDTRPKAASKQCRIAGKTITVTGIAKGAGMIKPNMATMLAYVATDAQLEPSFLQKVLQQLVDRSFNRITIDGDTSTNDACVLMASGASGLAIDEDHTDYAVFIDCLSEVFIALAQGLVRDGEGASKFVTVTVRNGVDEDECLCVAYAIAQSPLVKTALFASDPNWGRLLAAIGYSDVSDLDVNRVAVFINDILIAENGARAKSYTEAQGVNAMQAEDITITVDLQRGEHSAAVWTTDLSYDYVRINAEYRS